MQVCVDRPVEVVRVGCEDISLDKCITVPDIVTEVETSEVRREDLFSKADHCSLLCCRCAGPSWVPPTARRRSWSCPRRAASRLCTDTPTALRRGSRLSSEHVISYYAMQDPALEPGCYIIIEKIIYFI